MYLFPNKAEVTQVSLTGARLIVILSALMAKPRDLEELNQILVDCNLCDKNCSKDTIRIALSTLKSLDYSISRPCKLSDYKYVLADYPFLLKITQGEFQALKTVYTNLTKDGDYRVAAAFNKLLLTLCENINDPEMKQKLWDLTFFKKVKKDVYDILVYEVKQNQLLAVTYFSPTKRRITKHNLVFGKLFLKSNRLYFEGTDVETRKSIVLNMSRIENVEFVENDKVYFKPDVYSVEYKLANAKRHKLPENSVYKPDIQNGLVVKSEFVNKFFAIQYLMSFGPDCTILEPAEVRDVIINKYREMRKIYEQD